MKKAILLTVALLLVAGAANAQYIGLYVDNERSSWCATGVGFYPVEMWIWCLPGPLGQICAEFMVTYPVNVITSTVTWNVPIISVSLGDLSSGLSVCYVNCLYDWHWPAHQTLYVTDPTATYCTIQKHPDPAVEDIQFANCEPGYPTEPTTVLTNLYFNYGPTDAECMGTAVEETSWGAIKSLYR